MKGRRLSAAEMAQRREEMLAAAFRLFAEKNIDSVQMGDIARETGYTTRSLQRYFGSKEGLVVEAAVWSWKRFLAANRARRPKTEGTAAVSYAWFLDSFLAVYREHADLLRFNQSFNVFVRSQRFSAGQLQPYRSLADSLRAWFHGVYEKGRGDGTLRTDVPEAEIFSTTLHLMLAAVTRYAVGLVYMDDANTDTELAALRDMLLARYTAQAPVPGELAQSA